jgi:hydroxymethylpyrimidine pyrophosphatase-like HAD family hydrolase
MKNPHGIRCVALDFDLTVFDYKSPSDSKILHPWFEKLHGSGVQAGIASGRTLESLRYELEKLDMPWMSPFPSFVIHEESTIFSPVNEEEFFAWNSARGLETQRVSALVRPYFEECAARCIQNGIGIEEAVAESPAGVSLVLETPAAAETQRILLAEATSHLADVRLSRNHHILMATHAAYHKGSALHHWAGLQGIPASQILAIGDNLNDLCLFEHQWGFRCATVGNADPHVKARIRERAGHIAEQEIAFGVAEIFEIYFGPLRD